MAQVWIEIDDNENSGYFPVQTFEALGQPERGSSVVVDDVPGRDGPQEIVGWCSDNGGQPCDVAVILVGDSGSGQSRLVRGGDNGIRMRSAGDQTVWALAAAGQAGEPYILLSTAVGYRLT